MAKDDKQELTIKDHVLSPVETITVTYEGPKPLAIVKQASNIMKIGVDVSASALFDTIFKYDATDGSFYNKQHATRSFDKFTKTEFHVEFEGEQNLETGNGEISIIIWAKIITTFPHANSFQRTLWWVYYRSCNRYGMCWETRSQCIRCSIC